MRRWRLPGLLWAAVLMLFGASPAWGVEAASAPSRGTSAFFYSQMWIVVKGVAPYPTSTHLGPNRELIVALKGPAGDDISGANVALYVDDRLVSGIQASLLPNKSGLRIQLPSPASSTADWRDLEREIAWRPVTLTIGLDGSGPLRSEVNDFRVLSLAGLYAWFSVVGVFGVGLVVVARRSSLLRDGISSYAGQAPYSLVRVQVVALMCAMLAAFTYLSLVTGEVPALTSDLLILEAVAFVTFSVSSALQLRRANSDQSYARLRAVSRGFWPDILSDTGGASLPHVILAGWTLLLTVNIAATAYSQLAFAASNSALLVTGVVHALFLVSRLLATDRPQDAAASVTGGAAQVEDLGLAPLEVPDELVQALRDGQCVLYAGAGVSAQARLPTWRPFVTGLVEWAQNEGLIDADFVRALEQSVSRGDVDRAADSVVAAVIEKGGLDRLHQHLARMFGRTGELPAIHHFIRRLPFGAVLTTNFDDLIERAFADAFPDATRVPGDVEALRTDFATDRFFVLKLYGDLKQPTSLLVSPAQYVERIQGDQPFHNFVEQVFKSRSLLFLGSGVAGIEAYLAPLGIRSPAKVTHYALVSVTDVGWQTDAALLARRYGIRVLAYRSSPQHGELLSFLEKLGQRLAASREPVPAGDTAGAARTRDAGLVLERIALHNIGPFERLELPFTKRWTVLLGDNGVGKSSVLRAIGTVVAGDVAKTEGGRLLRAGQTEGSIELTSRGQRYGARVALDSLGRPGAIAEGASGLGGATLVLFFPAIRTMAVGAAQGPEPREMTVPPNSADVLPGLDSLPDPRILGFKQWLINLDYAKRRDRAQAERVDAIFTALGKAVATLLGTTRLGALHIDEKTVFIETEDGLLPLDALSQGTVSLLGWVGVLVQRIQEASAAEQGKTLVLIDEIDAHMHPEWQQAIVERLSETFPGVQFIVSSHSPFLAVGREAGEIVRFRRDPGTKQVGAEPTDRHTRGMTVADVLTSYLFGLQTPVDPDLERGVLRLRQLSVQPDLSEPERAELADLQSRLGHVGIAATQADPMYGQFIEQMRRQRHDDLANLPPMSKEAAARQRELTQRMVRDALRGPGDDLGERRS